MYLSKKNSQQWNTLLRYDVWCECVGIDMRSAIQWHWRWLERDGLNKKCAMQKQPNRKAEKFQPNRSEPWYRVVLARYESFNNGMKYRKFWKNGKKKTKKKNQKIRWINGQTNRRIKYKHDQNRCWCFYLLKLSLVPVLMPLHFSVRRLSLVRHCGNVWEVIRCEWDGSRCASETQSQTSNKNDRRTPYEKCWSNGMPARQRRNEHAERWISVGCESTADESMCTQWINVLAHIRQRREINADIRIGRKAIDEESMFDRFLWVCEKCLKRQKSAIKCIKKR